MKGARIDCSSRRRCLCALTAIVLTAWANGMTGCHSSPTSVTTDRGEPIELTVMTFNILFSFPNPEYDPWVVRRGHIAEIIRRHDPDLIGLQEPLPDQIADLHALCPGYDDALLETFPDSSIFFKADRFEKLEEGHYWLSPTPNTPFSIGFGNFFPRMVIWARLLDKETGRAFLFVNTHFDNTRPSQENSAPLFLERTRDLRGGLPVVITGDFNSKPDREAYHTLIDGIADPAGGDPFRLENIYDLAERREVLAREDDPRIFGPEHRIDHIFVAEGDARSDLWLVDMYTYGPCGMDPSDHFAVAARLELL